LIAADIQEERERHCMPKVSLKDTGRRFGTVDAVSQVSLEIEQGEFVTLLGPSGCGKTTTLRMVAGLEQATSGQISINGRVVSDASAGIFVPPEKRELGMVFQSYAIWPHMNVFENVAYPLRIRRLPKDQVAAGVERALRTVEMSAYAQRPATALSGGQQQRVAIARALAFEPQVLLLDEPLSNLDAKLRLQMADEFRALQQRLGITSLYVTHDQEEAMALSDRVVLMHAGRVLQVAAPQDIYERPLDATVARFFGSPNLLPARVTRSDTEDGSTMLQVQGAGWQGGSRAARAHSPGDQVLVMVRPENFEIGHCDASRACLVVDAVVGHATYRGARRSLAVQAAGVTMQVELPAMQNVQDGEVLPLFVRSERAWAIDDRQT
jgi:iron(III) transport system ATP-binding protein